VVAPVRGVPVRRRCRHHPGRLPSGVPLLDRHAPRLRADPGAPRERRLLIPRPGGDDPPQRIRLGDLAAGGMPHRRLPTTAGQPSDAAHQPALRSRSLRGRLTVVG
jgi:hypothetical protein